MMNTTTTRYARIPLWLRELHFVTDFFSWLFALCSRLAEPFMLICTLYIVAEAGVPAIALPALHNLAIGIMITAPELILPGAFVVAARAKQHSRLLFAVCYLFVLLTLMTLVSLFVWHLTGLSLAWLMCARCAVAVGYSILMRVMSHQNVDSGPLSQHIESQLRAHIHHLEAQVTALNEQVNTRFTSEHAALFGELEKQSSLLQAQLDTQLDELRQLIADMKRRSHLQIIDALPSPEEAESESASENESKAAFVHSCFSEHPELKNADIQRLAGEHGMKISPAYISKLRKAFTREEKSA